MGFKRVQRCIPQLGEEFHALHLNGIQTHSKMHSPAGWRVSRSQLERDSNPFEGAFASEWIFSRALLKLNGIQSHSKMHSPVEWRLSRALLNLDGIQTH